MASNEYIKEVAQSREDLVLGVVAAGELFEETVGQVGRDLVEIEILVFAPGEESTHGPGVGLPGGGFEVRAGNGNSPGSLSTHAVRCMLKRWLPADRLPRITRPVNYSRWHP